MGSFRLILVAVFAGNLVTAAEGPSPATGQQPVVLRREEAPDSAIVTLPGAPKTAKPSSPLSEAPEDSTSAKLPPQAEPAPPPAAKPAPEMNRRAFLPPDLQKDVALFCQRLIGQWSEEDAEQLLGKPLRSRSAFDEKKAVNGKIYAFADPTSRYRELELDFDLSAGTLRTVFAYPKRMTWKECRKLWNGEVSEADALQGRTFYSYLNRRMDVLVDSKGRVISLGLY
ncbi:MAG TPA: hypothetical protein VMH28_07320 [Candidatus Acidoferrales bacterium]|nr:hypothetical protein [Candidatus Acidoferrales bacterium]